MQKHVSIYWSDSAKNPGGRQDFNREVYINFMGCGNVATGRKPVKVFKILNGRQFYILSKFHKIERFQLI